MPDWRDHLFEVGYACIDTSNVSSVASSLGRAGQPTQLTARPKANADPWSLSGIYGLEAFPWHTDGAISTRPPKLILLRALRTSEPSFSELLDPDVQILEALQRTVLRTTDRHGRHRYLPAAVPIRPGRWRVRWDPRTCEPKTGMTSLQMEQQKPTARVDWQVNRLLIIDNLRMLHRRPAVDRHAERSLERTYIWET
jgi:L-asparagine oxygenase